MESDVDYSTPGTLQVTLKGICDWYSSRPLLVRRDLKRQWQRKFLRDKSKLLASVAVEVIYEAMQKNRDADQPAKA